MTPAADPRLIPLWSLSDLSLRKSSVVAPILATFKDYHLVSFCLELAFRCRPREAQQRREWANALFPKTYQGGRAQIFQEQWLTIRTETYPEVGHFCFLVDASTLDAVVFDAF